MDKHNKATEIKSIPEVTERRRQRLQEKLYKNQVVKRVNKMAKSELCLWAFVAHESESEWRVIIESNEKE